MTAQQLDTWFSTLTVAQKEHIGSKVLSKQTGEKQVCRYPQCTLVWQALSDSRKQQIHDHLTDDHGVLIKKWQEGDMYSE